MANENNNRVLSKLMDRISSQSQDLFKATYHSTDINKAMFDKVSDDLTDAIKTAIKGDTNYSDVSNTTRLYEKILKGNNGTTMTIPYAGTTKQGDGTIMDLFNDTSMIANLMDTYADTKWLTVLDSEIDMCIKYMPKLGIALQIKKDNVLCADSFSKSFINVSIDSSINSKKDTNLSENFKYIEKRYDFQRKAEQWYDNAAKYGEQFVYVVPYKKALAELLKRKKNTNYQFREQTIVESGKIVNQNRFDSSIKKKINATAFKDVFSGDCSIKLTMHREGILEDAVVNIDKATKLLRENMYCTSIYEQFLNEAGDTTTVKFNKTIDDVLTYEDEDKTSAEGLVGTNARNKSDKISVAGCVIRTLPRAQVLPLYIDDICLGYYYINIIPDNLVDANMRSVSNGYNSTASMFNTNADGTKQQDGDTMLRYIAGMISNNIDAAFINSNQDLSKEIYMMLKYNDQYNAVGSSFDMNVTYIPPEDIVHIRFNEDPITHRGRSDLWDGLIADKMWIMINSTASLGYVTRGQDKRVYYVKTMVETNVARTLLNVVSQIKKGNFGLRQMESINNILGLVGKFNDYVIPVGPSGESPISFDIMQGQSFDLPAELMNQWEESGVGCIVPLEIVNSSMSMDFAIRYTMTNGRLLKIVTNRQADYSKYLSTIYTKVYNCEFNDNVQCTVTLPPPSFLVNTQSSQLIQNAMQCIDALADVEMAGKSDEDRNAFRIKMLRKQLPSYIDVDEIERAKREIEVDRSINKSQKEVTGEEE